MGWRGLSVAPPVLIDVAAYIILEHRTDRLKLGYVIDDGPRNEAPGDADCGILRRGRDRPDRDVLVPQPRRPARRRSRRRSAPSPASISSVKGEIDISVFPASYVSFHDVGLKGGGTADPALQVDVLTANLRLLPLLLRRFEIADVMMLRPHIRVVRDGRRREQLDAVRRDHRAHHEARRRQPGVVLGNPDPGRRAELSRTPPTTSPRRSAISICRWPGRRSRARLPRPGNSTGAASASTARSAPATSSPLCRASAPG